MAERYSKLFSLPENMYVSGAPVIVAAGSLLKDNQTGKVLAQLKLKSISPKNVKAVKVRILPLDTVNKPLDGEIVYEYLDLNNERDADFGQKNAIPLSNASTRAFSVEVTEVDFSDNSVWTSAGEPWEPLPAPETVGDLELIKQYKLHFGENAKYKPMQERGVWICACGGVNCEAEDVCHVCGNKLSELLSCNMKDLAVERDQRLANEKAEREAKAAADKATAEANAKKTKKILAIAIPAVAVCIAAILLITQVIIPNSNYNKAKALLNAGQYDEAIAAFTALGGYKDSAEQLVAAQDGKAEAERLAEAARIEAENAEAYEKAEALFAAGDIDGAIDSFQRLGDYGDSEDRVTEAATAKMEAMYSDAVSLERLGQYKEAWDAFAALGDFKDSAEQMTTAKNKYYRELLSQASVGDAVFFGTYEQDTNMPNGKEDIEWIVLAREGDRLLVISRYGLDCQPYNTQRKAVTWETCTLRTWLNSVFLTTAFSEDERAMIPTVTVNSEKYPPYNTSPGNSTKDQIFLLSSKDAIMYFSMDSVWQCKPTANAVSHGCWKNSASGYCWYWLRAPGENSSAAAFIGASGLLYSEGNRVDIETGAVRPALWIDLGLNP